MERGSKKYQKKIALFAKFIEDTFKPNYGNENTLNLIEGLKIEDVNIPPSNPKNLKTTTK